MISTSNINLGSTALTPTGGTSSASVSLGDSLEKHQVYLTEAATTVLTRKSVDFTVKRPVVNSASPSGYTQQRTKVLVRYPITLGSGDVTVCTASIELASDVEMGESDMDNLRYISAQLISDTDFDNLFRHQSLN